MILYFNIFWISPDLAKFTYGGLLLPLEQPHQIEVNCFFCMAFLYYSQSGDDSQEDLAKFE
jgi:hypothetical protein